MASFLRGLKFIHPSAASNKPHVVGFNTARSVADDTLLEWWNGNSGAALVAKVDKDGRWIGGDGAELKPALSFVLDPNTGIYRPGADQLALVVGGSSKQNIATTGVTFPDGVVFSKETSYAAIDLGSSLTGGVAVDLALGVNFFGIATGNITFSFSNIPTGFVYVTLEIQTSATPHTISFPAGTTFGQDSLKTLVASKIQTFALYTRNGGTDWRAAHLANMDL